MEILIILIVIGIISFVIYQSLPSTKFQKATSLFDSGDLNEAIKFLNKIFEKHPDAPAKLAECKLKQGQNTEPINVSEAINFFNEAINIRNRLPINANITYYELIEAKSYLHICNINLKLALTEIVQVSKLDKIKSNLNFIASSPKIGCEQQYKDLINKHKFEISQNYLEICSQEFEEAIRKIDLNKKEEKLNQNILYIDSCPKDYVEDLYKKLLEKHFVELANTFFLKGIEMEKLNKHSESVRFYLNAKLQASRVNNCSFLPNIETRIAIIKLKEGRKDFYLDELEKQVNKSQHQYKKDFYYRYTIRSVQEKNYQLADSIISKYLNFADSAIIRLKEKLNNGKIEDAIKKVNEINYNLDQLYENSFPVDDVKNLYENLDTKIELIKSVIPTLTDKLKLLKPSLFNRLLTHYIFEEKYNNAIVLIQKFPSFWDSPGLLKNLGICCYGYIAQGNLSEKNYRTIISNWLTAVYSDKVVLKSIEETTWDDEYTFTLIDAIGSNYQQHSGLPVNVNYDAITDSNISIGATQRELLQQFETLLHQKISNNAFVKTVLDFYATEKHGIENIISIINTDILFATPYFAKTYGIHNEILEALENDYDEYLNEGALEAGVAYIKNKSENSVSKYAIARELVNKIISAINDENIKSIKSIVADNNKYLIDEFETVRDSVEDLIYNAFALKIEEDGDKEVLIALMNECILFASKNEKLKYQYSSYVADLCIRKVNADEFDNFKALGLMKTAYLYSKDNARICKNIVTLIRYNLVDITNDRTNNISAIYQMLDSMKNNRSITFKRNSIELAKARTDILKQLQSTGVDISQFTGTFSFSLTPDGEKLKKALTYMNALSEGSQSEN